MKKVLLAALLVPCLSFSKPAPVSFDFAGVSLVTFAQATFKSIMGRDYVIAPDVVAMDRKITISVKNIGVAEVPTFVENLLSQQGISTTKRGDVYYLESNKPQVPAADSVSSHSDGATTLAQVLDQNRGPKWRGGDPDAVPIDPAAESMVFVPMNRPADFIATVLSATFGRNVANLAGSRVVITASKERIEKVMALAQAVDVLPHKVNVSATFVEVSSNASNGLGVSLVANVLGAKLGVKVGEVGSAALSISNSNFQVIIDALNSDGRFRQVANPRSLVDEYDKSFILFGDETPTVAGSTLDKNSNNIQQTVYRPSGVILDVLPKVLGSGKINMSIDGQVSSFQTTTTGVNGSPTLVKRQVKTSVTVDDGEVVIIGGLNNNKMVRSSSGLPFLPNSWSVASGSQVQTDLVLILSAAVVK